MDVKRGCCWRCENVLSTQIINCNSCKIAVYCSNKCKSNDQYRHAPECEVWRPKKCNNTACTSTTKKLLECSACNSAWYCGSTCQRLDWKDHKDTCRSILQDIQNAVELRRFYLHSRSLDKALPFPYYIGNAIATDLLNLQENECHEVTHGGEDLSEALTSDYKILSAGCGNLRNLLHTTSNLPNDFRGSVEFHLNDFDPFVQARNILFLFIMITLSDQTDIAATLATIWYSLHLSKDHYQVVIQALNRLLKMTEVTLAEETNGLVLVDKEYLPQLRAVWQGWLNLQCLRSHPQGINLSQQRQTMFANDFASYSGVQSYKMEIPAKYSKSVDDWFENGIFLPSESECKLKNLVYDNPTLTGYNFRSGLPEEIQTSGAVLKSPGVLKTFVYCIGSDLFPFGEWDQLLVEKFTSNKSLVTMYHSYVTTQINSTIDYLKNRRLKAILSICNCLELSNKLAMKFDRIFTSNIVDYVGTKQLLTCIKPLLKETQTAVIILQYWNWKRYLQQAGVDGDGSRFLDGTYNTCQESAWRDVRHRNHFALQETRNFLQEYFNSTPFFVSFMRAEIMSQLDEAQMKAGKPKGKPPTFQQILKTQGLEMNNFRCKLNRVAPFAYRRNVRPVNSLPGIERMVEWRNVQDQ